MPDFRIENGRYWVTKAKSSTLLIEAGRWQIGLQMASRIAVNETVLAAHKAMSEQALTA